MLQRWRKQASYALVIIYFLGWALKDVIVKTNLALVDSTTLSMVVSASALLSALGLLLGTRLFGRQQRDAARPGLRSKAVLGKLVLLNLGMGAGLYTSTVAIELMGPVNLAVVDVLVYPCCLLLISRLLLHERVSRPLLWGLLVAIVGFAIFYADALNLHELTPLAVLLAALSSGCYAVALSLIKALLNAGLRPEEITFCRFLLLGAPGLVMLAQDTPQLPGTVWLALILIGALCFTLLSTLLYYGLKVVSATVVAIFVAGGPVFSAGFSWLLIPGTTYTFIQLAGLLLIVAGLLLPLFSSALAPKAQPAQQSEPA